MPRRLGPAGSSFCSARPARAKVRRRTDWQRKRKLWYLASGELFRRAIASGDEMGQRVRQYVERGLLVPDKVTMAVVMSHLAEPEAAAGVILDGFPRSRPQAEALDAALKDRNQRVDRVLYLNVPLNALEARLTGRWLCRSCTAVYHDVSHPPREAESL